MNRHSLMRTRILAAGIVLISLPPAVRAQQAESGTPSFATVPYLDKSLGFELQVPAGWDYDRTGFFGPGGSLGLLRGAAPGGRATLQILVFRELETPSFPDWIDYFTQQLSSISGAKRVQVKGETAAQRPAAYVSVDAQLGIDRTQTLYYCVQFDQDTIWVFSQATVARKLAGETESGTGDSVSEVQIPAEFTRLTSTLRVFYDPETARSMALALQRGKEYLARYQLQDDIRELRIDESPRYYEIRLAKRPIGYLTRQFTREDEPLQRPGRFSNAKEGLRVRERSYRFADDGTVHFSKADLFSSRDTETDLYELWQARVPPAAAAADLALLITRDQCVREGDALFSTCTTNRDQGLPEPRRPLKLDEAYLGLAWVRLLPALLGPQPSEMHAFTIYDSETRTLISHAIKYLGERPLPGSEMKAHAFETRAGFAEQPAFVYTDAYGNMLRYEAGQLVLRLSSEAAIEQQFARRRDAANLRIQSERKP